MSDRYATITNRCGACGHHRDLHRRDGSCLCTRLREGAPIGELERCQCPGARPHRGRAWLTLPVWAKGG